MDIDSRFINPEMATDLELLDKVDKAISITGTLGLTGGGDLSTNRTISMLYPEYSYVATAIQTSTSNQYGDVTQMVTATLPVGFYMMDFSGVFQSSATATGIGVRLGSGTATLGAINALWSISQAANGTAQLFTYNQLATNTNVTSASALAANTDLSVIGNGVFQVTVAGAVAIQIRSETNNSAISIRPGSAVTIKKVG